MSDAERLAASTLDLGRIPSMARDEDPVDVRYAPIDRLRAAGELEVRPKHASTPAAELMIAGEAIDFRPRDPRYAHTDEERVDVDALARAHDVPTAFLDGPTTRGGR